MEQDRIGRLWWRIAVILWLLGLSLALALMAEQVAQQADRKLDEPPTITYTEVVEIACIHEPWTVSEEDAKLLAQVAWCEAKGCDTRQQAAVMWCVLNRVDDERFPDSVLGVITQENQFYYLESAPITEELLALAIDTLARWQMEPILIESGRVLPAEYLWFAGNGEINIFRTEYRGGETWT